MSKVRTKYGHITSLIATCLERAKKPLSLKELEKRISKEIKHTNKSPNESSISSILTIYTKKGILKRTGKCRSYKYEIQDLSLLPRSRKIKKDTNRYTSGIANSTNKKHNKIKTKRVKSFEWMPTDTAKKEVHDIVLDHFKPFNPNRLMSLPGPGWNFEYRAIQELNLDQVIGFEKEIKIYNKAKKTLEDPVVRTQCKLGKTNARVVDVLHSNKIIHVRSELSNILDYYKNVTVNRLLGNWDSVWLDLCCQMSSYAEKLMKKVVGMCSAGKEIPIVTTILAQREPISYQNKYTKHGLKSSNPEIRNIARVQCAIDALNTKKRKFVKDNVYRYVSDSKSSMIVIVGRFLP